MQSERIDIYIANGSIDLLKDESTINIAKKRVSEYLSKINTGFSINNQIGGYMMEDGSYVIENSLRITINGNFTDLFLDDFIEHFKKLYNQESVLVCRKKIDVEYI